MDPGVESDSYDKLVFGFRERFVFILNECASGVKSLDIVAWAGLENPVPVRFPKIPNPEDCKNTN